jgi:hypothetical protein
MGLNSALGEPTPSCFTTMRESRNPKMSAG